MAIFVDENTKVVYQGLTGSQGRYYGLLNRDYGTQVVAGTNPKKAGEDVEGIPIFASVADAVSATGANASCIFIPAAGVRAAIYFREDGATEAMSLLGKMSGAATHPMDSAAALAGDAAVMQGLRDWLQQQRDNARHPHG